MDIYFLKMAPKEANHYMELDFQLSPNTAARLNLVHIDECLMTCIQLLKKLFDILVSACASILNCGEYAT